EEIIQGISEHISESLVQEDSMIIWGSGGTLRTIGEILGFNLTTLGIDISIGKSQIASDLNEQQITEYIQNHSGPISLLLSPMGGQGFLIGRGNLQLSPIVITMIGIDNILGIVTPSKLLSVRKLRIDTGDDDLDNQFSELKYMKVIQGFRTTRILPIEVT
ncbi:MAG: ATP-NAD kinase, partial [Euryarchaeota archaeon]|nr:ATP-NAD kinase [Euryarchaeota archaeon]